MHEWPLLIFTVAIPATVGGILFLWIMYSRLAKSGEDVNSMMKLPIFVLAIVSIVGLLGSFFHLGSPTSAINTLKGFGQSWMSNEIVFTGLFIALLCIAAGIAIVYKKVNPILMLITGVVGLIAIYTMATTYAVTRVNGWDHLNTYAVFFGTAIALGPVLAASLLLPSLQNSRKVVVKSAFIFGLVGIGIQMIFSAMFAAYTPEIQMVKGLTVAEQLSQYSGMAGTRWTIQLIGLIVLGYLSMSSKQKFSHALIYASLLVFVVAEGISRYLFYVLGA